MSAYNQWYPTSEMLPLNRREGSETEWVLGVWLHKGKVETIRSCKCESDGTFWLTPETPCKRSPDYWRDMPDFKP